MAPKDQKMSQQVTTSKKRQILTIPQKL